MGYGVGYVCKKCKNEKMILYETGFFDSSYEDNNFKNLIELGEIDKLQNINQLLNFIELKNVHIKHNYKHDAYICPKCKNIHNKFRYTLVSNNKRFIPKYKCDYCGSKLKIKKKNEDFIITCDECGSNKFEKDTQFISWD